MIQSKIKKMFSKIKYDESYNTVHSEIVMRLPIACIVFSCFICLSIKKKSIKIKNCSFKEPHKTIGSVLIDFFFFNFGEM